MTTVAILSRRVNVVELRRLLPGCEFLELDPNGSLAGAERAEVAIGGNDPGRVRALIAAAPRLRWYAATSAGVDGLVAAGLAGRPGLRITDASGAHAVSVAEHALALVLAAAKRLPAYGRHQAAGLWQRERGHAELRGATLVVYGLGAIGGETARLAAALGMRVIGVRRRPAAPPAGVVRVVGQQDLAEVAREADYLVLAAPLTAATRGSVAAAVLAGMKPTAWLVNVARGELVDEGALVAALGAGRLGGAALDVFSVEPLPPGHPFWSLPNVIITPHAAGAGPSAVEGITAIIAENLARFARGEPLANQVDPEVGY